MRAVCPEKQIIFYLITLITFLKSADYKAYYAGPPNFLHPSITSSLLGPNILLSSLFWNTRSLFVFVFAVEDQVLNS
jgi:hypothetical protein